MPWKEKISIKDDSGKPISSDLSYSKEHKKPYLLYWRPTYYGAYISNLTSTANK